MEKAGDLSLAAALALSAAVSTARGATEVVAPLRDLLHNKPSQGGTLIGIYEKNMSE